MLERLQRVNLRVNPAKFQFGLPQIEFLGHLVSAEGLKMSPRKVEALQLMKSPKDRKSLQAFLGLANYFRDFVENFSSRVVGMAAMQSKKLPFCWSEELEKEFVDIKGAIATAPMLVGIDYDFPIIVRTDASKVGVGAVLLQLRAGVECPVAFVSQKFSDEASRWSTIDQEAYAVYFALQQWSGYLRGQQFVVQTDREN